MVLHNEIITRMALTVNPTLIKLLTVVHVRLEHWVAGAKMVCKHVACRGVMGSALSPLAQQKAASWMIRAMLHHRNSCVKAAHRDIGQWKWSPLQPLATCCATGKDEPCTRRRS